MAPCIQIVRDAIQVTACEHKRLEARVIRAGFTVFNPDDRRIQCGLSRNDAVLRRVLVVLEEKGWLAERVVGNAVVLHSFENCQQQQWHTDYDPEKFAALETKPIGVILALQADTYFVTPEEVYTLNRGDLLCFDGDVVHAGAAYLNTNTRIHLYVDAPMHLRTSNTTWLTEE